MLYLRRKTWVHHRAHRKGLDGYDQIAKQRRQALILVVTGLARVTAWFILLLMYLVHVAFPHLFGFTAALFTSVAFVACISLYANAATDFGQVAASLAQLTAGDAHHDAEAGRRETAIDFGQLELDLVRLAETPPGKEAKALVAQIRQRLGLTA